MDAINRSRLEMARRALEFAQAHPATSSGYAASVAELADLLARAQQLTDLQRQGLAEVRAATRRKRSLRRSIRQGQLVHVAIAAQRAAKEEPELAQKFVLARHPAPYLQFQSLARSVAAEAEERKEVLVKHGLVDSVLVSLTESLAQFDQAVTQGAEGRRTHVAATVELNVVSVEAVRIVRLMDGHNRVRFAEDPDLMAAWKSASNVIGPARTGGQSLPREDRGADRRTDSPSVTPASGSAEQPAA